MNDIEQRNQSTNLSIKILPSDKGAITNNLIPGFLYAQEMAAMNNQPMLPAAYEEVVEKMQIREILPKKNHDADTSLTSISKEYPISLMNEQGDMESAIIVARSTGELCSVTCKYRDQVIEESAFDYFEAFCLVRSRLEQEALIPQCYGASIDVYPTGVMRTRASGLIAYKFREGKLLEIKDLVFIFSNGWDANPVTVREQANDWQDWLDVMKA